MVEAIPSTEEGGTDHQCRRMPQDLDYEPSTQSLLVGDSRVTPVSPDVWDYEVSGMNIIDKWFGYRRREPKGRKSSPLDEIHNRTWPSAWTTDLLNLLCVLQRCVDLEPVQADLLDRILSGPLVEVSDLQAHGVLPVPDHAREPLDEGGTGQMSLAEGLG